MDLARKSKSSSSPSSTTPGSWLTIAGICFISILVGSTFTSGCGGQQAPSALVQKGEARVSFSDLEKYGIQNLHGIWRFYPGKEPVSHLRKSPSFISVPGTWPDSLFSDQADTIHRQGMYELQLHLDRQEPFALRFTEVMTESCIYLDGEEIRCQGKLESNEQESIANTSPFTVVLFPKQLNPVLQIIVSNNHHRKGGIFGTVAIGTPDQIQTLDRSRMSRYLLVAGALLLTAVYFGLVGLVEGRAPTNLSLALFCAIAMIRIMTAGEKPAVSFFPDLPFGVYLRLQYITYFLSVAAALHYLYTMFPQDVHRTVVYVAYSIAAAFSLFAVAVNTTILSYSLDYYAVIFFSVVFYCTYAITRASFHRRTGSWFVFAGMMALLVAVIVDFLRVYELALVQYLIGDAILILVLCQAVATSLQNRNVHLRMGQLQNEKDQADAAARNNREFLSRMSHELRTPLHSIVHIGHLLKEERDPSRARDYVNTLQSASDHLLTLVNDVLDFNRMVQGKLKYQEGSFSLRLLLNRVVVIHRERAAGKGLDLRLDIQEPMPDRLLGDSHRISQVLHNLIGNAIKFTADGEIRVTVQKNPSDGEQDRIMFTVTDTGIGMSPDQLPMIFETYFQAGFQADRKHEGTGLGLAISQELVRLMGGDLKVNSTPDVGSEFSFSLPLKTDPEGDRPPELAEISEAMSMAAPELAKSRAFRQELIFIVDDNPDNRKLTGRFLEKWNLQYLEAASGMQALGLLEEHYPHLVLLDLHMPDMDGFATLDALREKGYSGPVIAATADVSNETRSRLDEAGFDGFIGKPFSPANFHQILSGYLNARQNN
ncbi:MAG: hypothetical protein CMN77_06300 [Spirochaetaceae bacterium]|nr:hypothetical protein [Spirochaetaceae bacterium]|tara:strand:- start:201 stop:2675 length:2475 start_codon:yes stop_codon:yes gene_type:complete